MFIVAITGGIATGKSTVSKVFERQGIPVIDADKIAREIVEPGQPCWQKIRETFGDGVFLPSKELNRAELGRLIFENKELRGKLNQITHPVIHRTIFWRVVKYCVAGHAWIVLDLPLLFETGKLMTFIHKIVTVSCDSDKQLQRLLSRDKLAERIARHRIDSQMPLEEKCEKSNFVIDNNGSIDETEASAMRIYNMMSDSKQHWVNRSTILGIMLIICMAVWFFVNVL